MHADAHDVCVGDCNDDGSVTVDEILSMVNMALGDSPIAACQAGDANGDGHNTVDEILTAVNNALNGCFSQPACVPVGQFCDNFSVFCCSGTGACDPSIDVCAF